NKILASDIKICATSVRVPVSYGHAESIYAEFDKEVDMSKAVNLLQNSPAVVFHSENFITPAEIGDSVFSHVCRLRRGIDEKSIVFWNVAHNVRLGAATNAVKIARTVVGY
ncbi:MAG: Asd/ArgC dimerization domain-containing protein, partial [Candidatus Cloacimonetes bacterium]|nr:Asd/ArgC dimerization domain-containing protein [Candidatus Cloacimonadota bacterium]